MIQKRKGLVWGAVVVLMAGLAAMAAPVGSTGSAERGRADIIIIDTLEMFGSLERPPVVFRHDKHTDAVVRQPKDCLACHPMENEHMSLMFQRVENTDKKRVMDIYHDQCIACHKEKRAQQQASGPVTCGGCHVQEVQIQSDWQPIGMDQSLHYRHVNASDSKCERCHHKYNPETEKLYYAKGQEEACIYCHKARTEENRISIQLAAHVSCLTCHRRLALQDKKAGPLECAGCHSPERQAAIETVENPPRIERNQPDVTLVQAHGKDEPPSAPQARMPRVPFNHKAHEGYTRQCRTCHHAALTPCADCHTIQGRSEGAMVKLAQAMHQQDAPMSCVGCHNTQLADPDCAGCHDSIISEEDWASETACRVCHVPYAREDYPQDPEAVKALAADLLAARNTAHQMVAVEDIPDIVPIDHLVDQFEAVRMPHRKIVLALAERTRANALATAFHTQPATLCQGCHHHSPPSLKPPECGACHGRTSDALNLTRPGLMAAFHEQCFNCHDRMGLEKPGNRDCAACHARRPSTKNEIGVTPSEANSNN